VNTTAGLKSASVSSAASWHASMVGRHMTAPLDYVRFDVLSSTDSETTVSEHSRANGPNEVRPLR
jgi:hypothetical protein